MKDFAWLFFDGVIFAGGFATCWFTKDVVTKWLIGTEAFVAKLQAKIALLRQ